MVREFIKIKYMPKVSVIIAVYNVAAYIEKCAVSLFEQTLDDIEYIFVDDCSTDNSIAVLDQVILRYPNRAGQVKKIRNPKNSKVAYTRTVGMKAATGEYVIHCDPDDYVEKDAYNILYETAISTGSDIVACNYKVEEINRTSIAKNRYHSTKPQECIKHLYQSYFFPSLCSHMVKRSLYTDNDIYPYADINTGEDLNVLLRVFHHAKKLTYIPEPFYHYIMRGSSLTHNPDVMALWNNNISKNISRLTDYFESTKDVEYETMLDFLKFTKKMFLLRARPPQTKMWYKTYPECRKSIMKFRLFSKRMRFAFLIFSYCYPLAWVYYKLR